MTLAKTDLRMAGRYVDALVDPALHPIFERIVAEHERPLEQVRLLMGGLGPAPDFPLLRRTLEVRDSYLEPLHHLQIELLARAARAVSEPDEQLHGRCC